MKLQRRRILNVRVCKMQEDNKKTRKRKRGGGPLTTCSTLARYRGRKIGVQVARVFRSGYFNGVIMYVCFTTSDQSLPDYTCNPHSRLYGAHGRLERVRPSMWSLRYIQSRNYHFCTARAVPHRCCTIRTANHTYRALWRIRTLT